MDDNTTLVLVAAVNVIGIFITAYFGYKASVNAKVAAVTAEAAVMQTEKSIAVSKGNADTLEDIKEKVKSVELGMNGMKDELVKATADAAKAEGKEEGKKEAGDLAEVVVAAVTNVVEKNGK